MSENATEEWNCGDCGHTETALVQNLAGREVSKNVGAGHRERTITVAVCPECGSEDWHSESIRDSLLGGRAESALFGGKADNTEETR